MRERFRSSSQKFIASFSGSRPDSLILLSLLSVTIITTIINHYYYSQTSTVITIITSIIRCLLLCHQGEPMGSLQR